MVGVSGSLVQGSRQSVLRLITSLSVMASGCVAGAIVVGSVIAAVASIRETISQGVSLVVFAVAAVALVAIDWSSKHGYSRASWRRQTCQVWASMPHRTAANIAWGFDLGLGFTTYRVSSLYWLGCLGTILFITPGYAPLVVALYAVGFMAGVAAGVVKTCGISVVSLTRHSLLARRVLAGVMLVLVVVTAVTV